MVDRSCTPATNEVNGRTDAGSADGPIHSGEPKVKIKATDATGTSTRRTGSGDDSR